MRTHMTTPSSVSALPVRKDRRALSTVLSKAWTHKVRLLCSKKELEVCVCTKLMKPTRSQTVSEGTSPRGEEPKEDLIMT